MVVAIQQKRGSSVGCAIAAGLGLTLIVVISLFWFLKAYVQGFQASESRNSPSYRVINATDGSCQVSVPAAWVDNPSLNDLQVLGVNDLNQTEFVAVIKDPKRVYLGDLADYARIITDQQSARLTSSRVETPAAFTLGGVPAIRQVLHGQFKQLRLDFMMIYFEFKDDFYALFCWNIESRTTTAQSDFEHVLATVRISKEKD